MPFKNQVTRIGLLVSITMLISKVVFAAGSGAYRVEIPDAGAMGMGSAFVGDADTPAAVYYNPAGITQMSSPEVSIGDALIAPRAHMTQPDGNTVHEQNNEFNIPNFYAVAPIIPNKLSIGFGSGSYFGLGTNWGPNSPLQYATTQANITDVDNSLVAAYQVTNQWSIAASADNDYSRADESYALNNAGLSPNGVAELKGGDDAWGYRLATMYKINDQNQIGLIYRSRIDHNYSGKLSINGANPLVYGLSSFVGPIDLKTVLPQSVVAGYSFKVTPKWTINADLEWVDWSSTKYQTINVTNPTLVGLGVGTPTPEDWHSAWSESIGTQYDVTDHFRVRLGYYHHEGVIPDATFNPNIPDSNSNGYTTGFGVDITKRLTLDVAYSFLVYDSRSITNSVATSTLTPAGTVDGKYSQYINMGLVSLTYKF
jgi:long-chain fatty acid transport protein